MTKTTSKTGVAQVKDKTWAYFKSADRGQGLKPRCLCIQNPHLNPKSRKGQQATSRRARMMIKNMKLKAHPDANKCVERFQFVLANHSGGESTISLQQLSSILDKQRFQEPSLQPCASH